MQFNNFSSFFEVLTGLNLTYSISEYFRNALDAEIDNLLDNESRGVENKIIETNSKIYVTISNNNNISSKLSEIIKYFEKTSSQIKNIEVRFRDVAKGFNSMFIFTSFYCLFILLLMGFEQFFECKLTMNFSLFALTIFVILFNFFIFARSFHNRYFDKQIKPFVVFRLILGLVIIDFIISKFLSSSVITDICNTYIGEMNCLLLAIFASVSPFFFHFSRVALHKWNYSALIYSLSKVISIELSKIEYWVSVVGNVNNIDVTENESNNMISFILKKYIKFFVKR